MVSEVQDILHQVPAEREGQLLCDNKFEEKNKKTKNEEKDSRGGNLEIWDGSVVNSQTTFLPENFIFWNSSWD